MKKNQGKGDMVDIDFELSTHLVNGKVEIANELLDILSRTLIEDFTIIKESYLQKDWQKLYNAVHRLCGSLCYCGVPKLQQAGAALKQAVVEKNEEAIRFAFHELLDAVDQFEVAYNKLQKN